MVSVWNLNLGSVASWSSDWGLLGEKGEIYKFKTEVSNFLVITDNITGGLMVDLFGD